MPHPRWYIFPTGRSAKAEHARRLAEDALAKGLRVIPLGRDGKPIIPPDWWRRSDRRDAEAE